MMHGPINIRFRIICQNYFGTKNNGIGSIEINLLLLMKEFFSFHWLYIPEWELASSMDALIL